MDAILTHENTDFDALASLLGAKKVYPEAIAVLPRRLNRNVRDFLALYGDALALTRQEDLPRRHMKDVVLVDTQNPPSARGIKQEARVHIVDHHSLNRTLKPGWTFSGGETGATTTLFVEEIRDKHLPLTPIEATLLLLGIYEDTGSLSFVTTSARDAQAAAFLLEEGASLSVVNDFLHQPLSSEQRQLYQQLLERATTIEIAGHPIVIADARANQYVEEVSTLAHQLRELYDPSALFVLVQMDDHIQLVARSDRPAIDVAAIAEAFGGGGHDKAAAALIQGADLKQTRTRLVKLLEEMIKPAITVRQLMSFGVHTLEPETTVAEAAEMMHRYGHEGFPVVKRNKLVGVLTRREIDRALHHQMGKTPIKDLMHKPASVTPDDSLEKLRTVMMESDLGQVPVVQDKKIIGIVTRTDLIRLWEGARPSRAEEMAVRLDQWLPPELSRLLHQAGETAHELGYSLYVVGGFVRDLLLNQPNLDFDLVVEGDAIALAAALAKKYGGRVHAHTRFGTAKWIRDQSVPAERIGGEAAHDELARDQEKTAGGKNGKGPSEDAGAASDHPTPVAALDFTTARTEFYAHPSALPEVERSSIKQDLRRRDFTINTLAIGLDPERYGQLLDPFGGEADLQRGLIRVLHNLSFVEDPTRIMRAVRLEQRLGFKIEARTAELVSRALEMLPRVSGQRIKHELTLIFQEQEPERAMLRLDELGVLRAIFPSLTFDEWQTAKFRAVRGAGEPASATEPIVYLGLLAYHMSAAQAAEFANRLRLSNADRETLLQLIELRDKVAAPLADERLSPSAIYHWLEGYKDEALEVFAIASDSALVRERVQRFLTDLRYIAPQLTGRDLKRMGLAPGPAFRKILTQLRDARLDGEISSRAEEEALVRAQVEGSGQI